MNATTVDKKGICDLSKKEIKVAFVAVKPNLKIKVSSMVLGGNFPTHTIDFEACDGVYIPETAADAHVLRIRQRRLKDVVALGVDALKKALSKLEDEASTETGGKKPKKGKEKDSE